MGMWYTLPLTNMKYKIEATIPTQQYGNLRPTFEVENEQEEESAYASIKRLWSRFGESELKDRTGGGVLVKTFTGEEVLWNEATHTYTDLKGKVLLSGSKYAELHSPKFDIKTILPKTAKSWEVPEDVLAEIWKASGEVSTNYGTAIHKALEIALKYWSLGRQIQEKKDTEKNYLLPKNSRLARIVEDFLDKYGSRALPEVVVSDVKNGMSGTIDYLLITDEDKKECFIGDYKTNAEMDAKKLLRYQKQLSFYAHILQNHGWKVNGLHIFTLNEEDKWDFEELTVLPLEE